MDAKLTWNQISTGAKMQVGARHPVISDEELVFEVLEKKAGITYKVIISLNDEDTYDLKLIRINTKTYDYDTIHEFKDIYAEDLSRVLIMLVDKVEKRKRNQEDDNGYSHQFYDDNPSLAEDYLKRILNLLEYSIRDISKKELDSKNKVILQKLIRIKKELFSVLDFLLHG